MRSWLNSVGMTRGLENYEFCSLVIMNMTILVTGNNNALEKPVYNQWVYRRRVVPPEIYQHLPENLHRIQLGGNYKHPTNSLTTYICIVAVACVSNYHVLNFTYKTTSKAHSFPDWRGVYWTEEYCAPPRFFSGYILEMVAWFMNIFLTVILWS